MNLILCSNYLKFHQTYMIKIIKYIIGIYIFFIQISFCHSQYRQEWVKSEGQNESAFGSCVRVDNNNDIYVSGSDSYSQWDVSIYLLKYDNNGNKLWERRYGDSLTMVEAMEIDENGNIIITGTFNHHCLTLKYDGSGNLIWVRNLLFDIQGFAKMLKIDKNNNVYVCGNVRLDTLDHYNYFLIKYDSVGNQIWYREYNGDGYVNMVTSMTIDRDNNIYMTGNCIYYYTGWRIGTVKYSQDGILMWERRYYYGSGSISGAIAVDTSNNIIITCSSSVVNSSIISTVKYDVSGNLIWERTYRSNSPICFDYPVKLATDIKNNIYLTAFVGTDYNYIICDYLTMKYYPNGDTAWVKKYINPVSATTNRPHSLAVDKYSNVFITGTICMNTGDADFYSIFYDSVGQTISSFKFNGSTSLSYDEAWDITFDSSSNVYVIGAGDYDAQLKEKLVLIKYSKSTGITNISNEIPEKYFLSQNYPNPFNATTKIDFKIPVRSFVTIKMYDILGKEIKSISNGLMNPGIYSYNFDASELTSGIYFYRLQSEKFIDTKKMVLIK